MSVTIKLARKVENVRTNYKRIKEVVQSKRGAVRIIQQGFCYPTKINTDIGRKLRPPTYAKVQ